MAHDSLLAAVLQDHGLVLILPLGFLDIFETVRVGNGEVLAQDLYVVDGLFQVVMDVLLHGQNSFRLVGKLQLLRQLIHPEVLIIVREG
jgi:hypothetical protein